MDDLVAQLRAATDPRKMDTRLPTLAADEIERLRAASAATWRETVRDIYDALHFGPDGIFTGSALAQRLLSLIEGRHREYFCEARLAEPSTQPAPSSPADDHAPG